MSNQYINIYKGNPTAGGTDGTAVSTDGTYTAPVSVVLDVATGETKTVKLAIRCDSGYTTSENTVISADGDRWKFCLTENGTYTETLTISQAVTDVNTILYAKISSGSYETPHIDRSVSIRVQTKVRDNTNG